MIKLCEDDQYSIISLKLKNVIHVCLGWPGWPLGSSALELHHYPISCHISMSSSLSLTLISDIVTSVQCSFSASVGLISTSGTLCQTNFLLFSSEKSPHFTFNYVVTSSSPVPA